jgi:hypothetical protein
LPPSPKLGLGSPPANARDVANPLTRGLHRMLTLSPNELLFDRSTPGIPCEPTDYQSWSEHRISSPRCFRRQVALQQSPIGHVGGGPGADLDCNAASWPPFRSLLTDFSRCAPAQRNISSGGRLVSAPLVMIVRRFLLAIFSTNAPNVT